MSEEEITLPQQVSGGPAAGACGGIVPAPAASSSSVGLPGGLAASLPGASAIASEDTSGNSFFVKPTVSTSVPYTGGPFKLINEKGTIIGNIRCGAIEREREEEKMAEIKRPLASPTAAITSMEHTDFSQIIPLEDVLSDMEIVEEETTIPPRKNKRTAPREFMKSPEEDVRVNIPHPNKKTRKSKTRRVVNTISSSSEEEVIGPLTSVSERTQSCLYEPAQYAPMTSMAIGVKLNEYIDNVDSLRRKSKNLKGTISREIEDNLAKTREAIDILANRAAATGDTAFLSLRVKDLERELASSKGEILKLKAEITELNRKASFDEEIPLANRVSGTKRKSNKASREEDEEYIPPVIRPALLGSTKVIEEGRMAKVKSNSAVNPPLKTDNSKETSVTTAAPQGTGSRDDILLATLGQMMNLLVSMQHNRNLTWHSNAGPSDDPFRGTPGNPPPNSSDGLPQRNLGPGSSAPGQGPVLGDPGFTPPGMDPLFRREVARNDYPRNRRTYASVTGSQQQRPTNREYGLKGFYDLEPLPPQQSQQLEWQTVKKRGTNKEVGPKNKRNTKNITGKGGTAQKMSPSIDIIKKRLPKTAAISVTKEQLGNLTYADALKLVRQKISLKDHNIDISKVRRAITGGLIIEISGEEATSKADKLASQMSEILQGGGIKVARPSRKVDLRVSGLDESVTPDEIISILAEEGKCSSSDIRCGPLRAQRSGLYSVWAQGPAANMLDVVGKGRIRAGWTFARVELLKKRPLQCFRCLAAGHTIQRCPGTDRSLSCFNCGQIGHKARECTNPPKCPICAAKGIKANHRAGSRACPPCPPAPAKNDKANHPPLVENDDRMTDLVDGGTSNMEMDTQNG